MDTPDATFDAVPIDTTSLDRHRTTDPTIPRSTSLTFSAQMERDFLPIHGAPANRADVEVASCGEPQIPQWRPTCGAETGDGDDDHLARPQAIHDVQHTHAPTHVDDRLTIDQPAAAAHDVEPLG